MPSWLNRDAADWAASVSVDESHQPRDAEQAVFERAPYILDRANRLSLTLPIYDFGTRLGQIFLVLSVAAPVSGFAILLVHPGSLNRLELYADYSSSTENLVIALGFAAAFVFQMLRVYGWLKLGRRTRRDELQPTGIMCFFCTGTLILIAVRDHTVPWQVSSIFLWLSFLISWASMCVFFFGRSEDPFPPVDLTRLSKIEIAELVQQRDLALRKLAARKLIKERQANRATKRPLGALVGREVK